MFSRTEPGLQGDENRQGLPPPVKPLGAYVQAVRTGNLLFLTGMLPTVGHEPKFRGRIGKELDAEQGREAAYAASPNALAVARQQLGSLYTTRE